MQRYRTGDQALVREINLSTVLRCLQESAPLSRARLADRTGLNKTTVSSLVEELVERGLVHQVGLDNSKSGRPATLLDLAPQAGHIIGVELGVGFITVILTDFVGQIIWRRQQETDTTSEPQEAIVAYALNMVEEAKAASQTHGARLLGMGLALPGMVDVQNGTLLFSPNLQWRDVDLGQIFFARTGIRVFVENDATAAALGEHLFGVARQAQNFIFLIAGVGLGSGLFLNGDLYRGAGGIAGEVGHTSISMNRSRPCRCGSRGCWEASGNQYSLIERVRALLEVGQSSLIPRFMAEKGVPLDLSVISQAADAGDAVALEALSETSVVIGMGLANLINIFNPEMVVVGGAMSTAGHHLLPSIERAVQEHALTEMLQQVQIVLSAFGPDASVMGAVALVVKAILSSPSSVERLSLL
ncbi:MAG: ROK family transcriptional regulator [Anaerolineae bacterium]|jgi:glucokinase-like ROK family protein